MSVIVIIGAAALIAAPCEAIYAHLNRPRVYRKRSSILEIKKARRPSTNASFHA